MHESVGSAFAFGLVIRGLNGLLEIHSSTRTFSIENSSSALTLISRAFSRASCLMKAV